ncbi:MAG: response regulator, partial [Lentilitoribacter sp.]
PLGRKILQEYMTNWGFESAACVDAEEGMEMLIAMRKAGIAPDLVITDYIMPGLNGAQFIEKLNRSPDFNTIPVILLAQVSNTGNDDITKVSDRCVTVSKPFCIETIKPALDKRLPTTSSAQTRLAS